MSAAFPAETYAEMLDSLPHVIMRLEYIEPCWRITYINKAVERWGYSLDDFASRERTWNELVHPDDRVIAQNVCHNYELKKIDDFKQHYRVVTKDGASIYVTEHSHVHRNPDGSQASIDTYLVEDLETAISGDPNADAAIRRSLALTDILLTIQDAKTEPEKAIQYILHRTGELLDCSRALLFKDSDDHKSCKVMHEWLNNGISSIKDLDYQVNYEMAMPDIYRALRDTGVLFVNAGEIPESCRKEFEAEGLVSSAIFAVYQYGDHYGFVCFDDCVVERRWDQETANFLKIVSNLFSNVLMSQQSAKYAAGYEKTIKDIAFSDYLTGLPNRYPCESDFADAIISARTSGKPAYAAMLIIDSLDAILRSRGYKATGRMVKIIAGEIRRTMAETLGDRATLYKLSGTIFTVIVQPGDAAPVADFAKKIAERGQHPWEKDGESFTTRLNVSASPFGVKLMDPDIISDYIDALTIKCATLNGLPLLIADEEPSA